MNLSVIIVFLGLLIFGTHLFNALFKRTKIPNALILLTIGMIIGPIMGLVKPEQFGSVGPVFTTLTLIILMFESGINLKLKQLVSSIGSAFSLTVFNFIVSMIIATSLAHYVGQLELTTAAFFGAIVSGTSSAIVIPIVKQLKMNEKGETVLLLESAISDVLCLVVGLGILETLKKGEFEAGAMVDSIWKSFAYAALIGIICGMIWSLILQKLRTLQNHTFTNLAIVMILYGVTEYFKFNGGIATLCFGIALGNSHLFKNTFLKSLIPASELTEAEKSFFAEIVFILQTYFFVYLGVCIKFGNPLIYLLGLVIVGMMIIVRPISVKLLVRGKMSLKDLSIMSIMTPKGLVPAILAAIPLQLGIAGGETIRDISYAVVIFSIIICSILVIILSKDAFALGFLRNMLLKKSTDSDFESGDESEKTIKASSGITDKEEYPPEKYLEK